ncbi:hypothetical protein ACNQKP_05045 [Bdellovibrio bacteriovorus]|uniref:hypothetical protein n=1 Tax=Bdellovibrio bacteriovorus TaxID=959 RepID=UPI003AA9DA4E
MRDELQTARRNFPRAEYQLVKDSFPETLHHLSPTRLNEHIERCQKLIQSYRVRLSDKESLQHAWRGPDEKIGSARLIRYRMNELNACLRKFRSQLKRSKESAAGRGKSAKAAISAKPVRKAVSAKPTRKTASKRISARKSVSAKKAKSSSLTRSAKAKRTMSAKMKSKPSIRTKKAGTSKTIKASGVRKRPASTNGKQRREATIDELSFAPKSEEQFSRAMTQQPKMRLPRKSLKKGGQALHGRQASEILPSNSINPALRRR